MEFALDAGSAYEILAPAVLGYLRAMGAPEPEDLLGEVFVHVVRDVHRFRGDEAAARSWVFTIAHHRLIDDRRRRARRPVTVRSQLPDRADDADPATLATVADPTLIAALAQLTADQRAVLALRFVADLPIRDVAGILRRRVGAVKALQNRALNRLASLLGD
jgi:RNA polymerase sigma-70 factor (ECF subfamily)